MIDEKSNLRSIERLTVYKITVLEGKGVVGDPVREVVYFMHSDGSILFALDPSKKGGA